MSSPEPRRKESTRRQPRQYRRGDGFTLIEILVALLILGIMSALGYGTYRAARVSAEHTEESLQRAREIEFGMRMMVQDFAEAVPRPVRDILGQTRLPALQGTGGIGTLSPIPQSSSISGSGSGSGSDSSPGMSFSGMSFNSGSSSALRVGSGSSSSVAPLIELTRAGWSNTAGQQRGTLQRVSYGLVDDVLKRSYQVNLDAVQGNKPVVQDLFTGVKAIQLRYLDGTNQTWQAQWPPPATVVSAAGGPADNVALRPVAIEVIIEFKDWGRIRRVVEVAG
jgi:type II secretion system protein J